MENDFLFEIGENVTPIRGDGGRWGKVIDRWYSEEWEMNKYEIKWTDGTTFAHTEAGLCKCPVFPFCPATTRLKTFDMKHFQIPFVMF